MYIYPLQQRTAFYTIFSDRPDQSNSVVTSVGSTQTWRNQCADIARTPLSIARYSFVQLRELDYSRMNGSTWFGPCLFRLRVIFN